MADNLIFENEKVQIRFVSLQGNKNDVFIMDKEDDEAVLINENDFELACSVFLHLRDYEVKKREPELKPCPVCGNPTPTKYEMPNNNYIYCYGCGIRIDEWEKMDGAIKSWNALPRKDE